MICYKCQNTIPDYSLVCTKCGAELSANARSRASMGTGAESSPFSVPMGMAWFSLLVSFYLFFEAVASVLTAIEFWFDPFAVTSTGSSAGLLITFSQLGKEYKIIDIIYGLLNILAAVWAVMLRFQLAGYKKRAPFNLLLYFSVPSLVSFGYNLALLIVAHAFSIEELLILLIQLAIQGAIVYANYIYFKKRKHLFVN